MNRLTLKGKKLAVLLVFALLLSGCSGFKDIDKRAFVVGVGVDGTKSEKNPYRITLKIALPTGSFKESPTANYTYLTIETPTLAEGIRMLKSHTDEELDFSHAKIIIFGKDIIHRDMREVSDLFLRRRDFQAIAWVTVGDPSAEEVLRTKPPTDRPGANTLFNIFSNEGTRSPYIVTTYLYDFARRIMGEELSLVLPVIQAAENKKELQTNRSIIFKDGKEKMRLTSEQTKYYSVLANKTEVINVVVKKKDLHLAAAVDTIKANYKIVTRANQPPVIKMNVKIKGIIEEAKEPISADRLGLYSKYVSEKKEKDLTRFLKTLQKNNVDPLGFGLRYKATRLHNRDLEAEWQRLYPQVTFDVNVQASLKSTGVVE